MKKLAILALVLILGALVWNATFDANNMHVVLGDEELHGPLAALVGILAGSFGLVVALLAMVFAAVVVALVFAGLGALAITGLALGAAGLALLVSPLLLPFAIIAGILWYSSKRRKAAAAMPALPAA